MQAVHISAAGAKGRTDIGAIVANAEQGKQTGMWRLDNMKLLTGEWLSSIGESVAAGGARCVTNIGGAMQGCNISTQS